MAVLKNRAKMSTSTTGTGSPITLGSAEDGYQTFADAGVANADVVRYVIEDGSNFEIGTGTYTSSGTTLSRTVSESSNSDAAINLSGSATVFIGATAEDIPALYADNYDGTSTLPSATGTNAVALQDGAVASGNRGFAAGRDAVASGTYSVALGTYTDAVNFYGTAIGYNAQAASGDGATALTNSRASGAYSFAAAIANNTSSYGATGANSVAIGAGLARATTSRAMAFGNNARAEGADSVAIGRSTDATASASFGFGYAVLASHANSLVFGTSASSSAINQITLGSTSDTVRISSAYTLPTSDGSANQVLTTDGSGAVTFADAGGSLDLFAENYDGTSTKPSATGTNTIAIGQSAVAGNADDGIAIGRGANCGTATQNIAIGAFSDCGFNSFAMALGRTAQATGGSSLALGVDSAASHDKSVAIGKSNSNGDDSFAAQIVNNTTSYGAQGNNSIAMGYQAKATNTGAVAIGYQPQATGLYSIAIGDTNTTGREAVGIGENNTASGLRNTVIGYGSTGTADYSTTLGVSAADQGIKSRFAFSGSTFNNDGDSQHGMFPIRAATTDATATALTTDGNAASTNNQIILPNNSAYSFSGTIIARESAAAGSDYASWEIKGALLRDANAASTVLGNGIQNKLYATSGASAWAIALSADTTNGGLKIEVTGAASTNIRWVATVNTSEVTYA